MKPSVFLSHSSADKIFARNLAKDLQNCGVYVWIDEGEIKLGDSLIEKISEGIDKMNYLLVVLSTNSIKSNWVRKEVNLAITEEIKGQEIKVLPLILDDVSIPLFLRDKLYADFSDPTKYSDSFKEITSKLGLNPINGLMQPKELNNHAVFEDNTINSKNPEEKFKLLEEKIKYTLSCVNELLTSFKTRDNYHNWVDEFKSEFLTINKKWEERRFQVAIMGLMKSGKSTILNSWIGNEYLPSGAVAETMRIVRIRHIKSKHVGTLFEDKIKLENGSTEIRRYLRNLNTKSRKQTKEEKEKELILEVSLAALKNRKLSGYGFDIVDTPGTNESGLIHLQGKVERLAKQSDVIIYLLDFTKLKTKDEEQMLVNLKEWKSELFDQFKSRMFFVVNKIDTLNRHDREKKMTPIEVKRYVKDIIKKSIQLNINEDDIVLISSERALLGRLIESNNASDDQKKDFKQIAFGEFWASKASEKDTLDAVPQILENSGFKDLEDQVLKVIYNKRSQIFLSSLLDDLVKCVQLIANYLKVGQATLKTNEVKIVQLQEEILNIQNELDAFSNQRDNFKKKAHQIINSQLDQFKKSIQNDIKSSFIQPNSSEPVYSWIKKESSFWYGNDYVVKHTNPHFVEQKFKIIHQQITRNIEVRFDIMWNNIFNRLYETFKLHQTELEKKSEPIVFKVEKTLNKGLNIRLKPTSIEFKTPSFENFYYQSLNQLNSLIVQKTESNMSFFQSFWNGFLQWFDAGEKEIFTNTTQVSCKQYSRFIENNLDKHLYEPKKIAFEMVNAKYLRSINSANQELKQFVVRYKSIIADEIGKKGGSKEEIKERTKTFHNDLNEVKNLLSNIQKVQNFIK